MKPANGATIIVYK